MVSTECHRPLPELLQLLQLQMLLLLNFTGETKCKGRRRRAGGWAKD